MAAAAETNSEIKWLGEEIRSGTRVISIGGLTSISAKAFILNELRKVSARKFAVLTETNSSIDAWQLDLSFWNSDDEMNIVTLPSFETDIYSGVSPHAETQERRALALWQMTLGQPDFLVTTVRSLAGRLVSPDTVSKLGAVLTLDEDFPLDELVVRLASVGYVREDPVNGVGQFSIRGGIVDIWPPDSINPMRIEFFGDTVDSIREFDAETQLSTGQMKEIAIAPMREFAASAADLQDWAFFARERWPGENLARNLKDRTDFADQGESFSGWEFLLPLVKPLTSSIFDYLNDTIFVIDEPSTVESVIGKFYYDVNRRFAALAEAGDVGLKPNELLLDAKDLRGKLNDRRVVELRALGKTASLTDEEFLYEGGNPGGGEHDPIPNVEMLNSDPTSKTPLFLFPAAENSSDIEIASRSTRKFHGNIADFVATAGHGSNTPLFVMQSS
ncbi:MAG: hypothetical protein ABIU09_11270, partial [Pyrinomonadaceae bacterium]